MRLLTILCLVLLSVHSYSQEIIDEEFSRKSGLPRNQLVERQGIKYKINSTTPFTGSSVVYHDNGQLWYRENYKDGKQDGLHEGFWSNGQLWIRTNYKDGKEDGLHERFYDNLVSRLHSFLIPTTDRGQLKVRGNYKNGEEDGLWEEFFEHLPVDRIQDFVNTRITSLFPNLSIDIIEAVKQGNYDMVETKISRIVRRLVCQHAQVTFDPFCLIE